MSPHQPWNHSHCLQINIKAKISFTWIQNIVLCLYWEATKTSTSNNRILNSNLNINSVDNRFQLNTKSIFKSSIESKQPKAESSPVLQGHITDPSSSLGSFVDSRTRRQLRTIQKKPTKGTVGQRMKRDPPDKWKKMHNSSSCCRRYSALPVYEIKIYWYTMHTLCICI